MNDTLAQAAAPGWLRRLPDDKPISALGFGCSSAWAKPGFDEDEAQAILAALVEEGVNHFDTSPSYGEGTGEARLGRFLTGRDPANLVISTKVGTNLVDGQIVRGFTRDLMERSFADSLQRLCVPRVDILYLHGPSREDLAPGSDVHAFFSEQKARGTIGFSGVNSFDPVVLDAVAGTTIDGVMLQYNVDDFRNATQLAALHAAGKFVMSGTVLSRAKFNLAAFLPRDRTALWYLLRMMRSDPLFIWNGWRLKHRLKATGLPPATAAIRFATDNHRLVSSLFGTSRLAHARANAQAGHGNLPPGALDRLAAGRK